MSESKDFIPIEEVMPLLGERKRILRRIDLGASRHYYTTDGGQIKFYPSWTTVIKRVLGTSEYLVKWIADMGYEASRKYMQERAHYGTMLHICLAKFLVDKKFDMGRILSEISMYAFLHRIDHTVTAYWAEDLKSDILAFAQFCADKELAPIAVEMPLTYEAAGIAGTIDIVCELKFGKGRVRAIVDIKSGRKGFYPEHRYQLHGYKAMWDENFPELAVDMVFNWSPKEWTKSPTYNFENQTDAAEGAALAPLLSLHALNHPDSKPSPKRNITGLIELGSAPSENFEFVEVEAFLRAKHGLETTEPE